MLSATFFRKMPTHKTPNVLAPRWDDSRKLPFRMMLRLFLYIYFAHIEYFIVDYYVKELEIRAGKCGRP